jgi:hypothetical protein
MKSKHLTLAIAIALRGPFAAPIVGPPALNLAPQWRMRAR